MLFILLFSLLLLPGCTKNETPKKVSLNARAGEGIKDSEQPQPNILWFGFDLRLSPKEEVRIYTQFLRYLEITTGKHFRIKFTEKYEDTVENLGKGVTHFAALGTLSYVVGEQKHNIKYLVSGVNTEGDLRYQSVIFTRPGNNINNVEDIRGKCFAFGAEISTQDHLIPRKMLDDAGITLNDLGKFIYTGSHLNVVKSVLNGACDAGGIQDVLAKRLAAEGQIKIIQISEPYPSSVIAYNSNVDIRTVEAVRTALLEFEPTGRHKDQLIDWDKTEMPMGFRSINELELINVTGLARRYGLIEK